MEKGDKRKLIIGTFLFLVFVAILWYAYRQGKKTTTIAKLPTDNVGSGTQSTGVGDAMISGTATSLYNDMKGLNLFGYHNEQPYSDAMTYSDTDFVKLYNIFNTKYQKDSSATLTEWINGESAVPYSPFDTIKTSFVARLGKLNLK